LDSISLVNGQTGLWYEWDVTTFINAEAAGDQTASLVIKPVTEDSATYLTYAFDAREYSSGAYAPILDVQWQVSSQDPAQVAFFYHHAPDGLSWGSWTAIGTDSDSGDGWQQAFAYPDGQGYYEFYAVSTDADANIEDAPVRADARAQFNNPPAEPTDPGIANGSVDIALNPTLSVTVADPDGASMDVFFYDAADSLIGSDTGVASGGTASVVWADLTAGTEYGWYAVADDGIGANQTPLWTFTTMDAPAAAVPAGSTAGMIGIIAALMFLGAALARQRAGC
jgi:hypothetical protein